MLGDLELGDIRTGRDVQPVGGSFLENLNPAPVVELLHEGLCRPGMLSHAPRQPRLDVPASPAEFRELTALSCRLQDFPEACALLNEVRHLRVEGLEGFVEDQQAVIGIECRYPGGDRFDDLAEEILSLLAKNVLRGKLKLRLLARGDVEPDRDIALKRPAPREQRNDRGIDPVEAPRFRPVAYLTMPGLTAGDRPPKVEEELARMMP